MLTHRFTEALVYAAELHSKQTRKGSGIPYISHLMSVCSLSLEYGANEDEAIAALLHDAIEDQGGVVARDVIRQKFGETVTAIVDGCTDSDATPKPPWRERKQTYISHLPMASASVRLVSACDKLHNARSILTDYRLLGEAVWDRFKGGKQGTLWYYRALVQAFRQVESTALVEELDRVVSEIERLATSYEAETPLV
jgi:(p)ppGpp synthase/HD superfamily hydrolase